MVESSSFPRSPATALEAAFYGERAERLSPVSYEELADVVRYAEQNAVACVPSGRGTHAYLGRPPDEDGPLFSVSTEQFSSVLRYEPGDFTVGVQSGLSLAELRSVLEGNRQEIPVDFPKSATGTVGGLVAAGFPGPRRAYHGSVASSVLGIRGMRGGGRIYRAGGMVVKNVAGYEVEQFLCGSLGTAGVILEVNFRLRQLPQRRSGSLGAFRDSRQAWGFARALRRTEPVALATLNGGAAAHLRQSIGVGESGSYEVAWFFEGSSATVKWLEGEAEKLIPEHSPDSWTALPEEQVEAVFEFLTAFGEPLEAPERAEGIVRISVLPGEAAKVADGLEALLQHHPSLRPQIVSDVLAGQVQVRWEGPDDELDGPLKTLPEFVSQAGAGGWLIYLSPTLRRRWPYLLTEDPSRALAAKVRDVFDPAGIFCPGRINPVFPPGFEARRQGHGRP